MVVCFLEYTAIGWCIFLEHVAEWCDYENYPLEGCLNVFAKLSSDMVYSTSQKYLLVNKLPFLPLLIEVKLVQSKIFLCDTDTGKNGGEPYSPCPFDHL